VDTENLSFETFKKVLKAAGYKNELLALEITYGGMATGPAWYTDVFGFDYGILATEKVPKTNAQFDKSKLLYRYPNGLEERLLLADHFEQKSFWR